MSYGNVIYTVDAMYIAPLNSNNTYGTPAALEYPQDGSYEPQTDTDMIKSQGANREMLAVTTHIDITINEASMADDAVNILTGETATESGASGNRQKTRDISGGGSGNPYIGIILVFNATNGSKYVAGFPRAMAKNKPQFKAEQNKFRTGEMQFSALATSPSVNKMLRTRKYENAADVPNFSSAVEWDNFFAGIFS